MTTAYKTLGQVVVQSNTITNVYSTGTGTQAIVGTITLKNLDPVNNCSYSLIVRPSAQTQDRRHFIIRGGILPAGELITITGAVCMNSNCILAANTTTSGNVVVVHAYGAEIS
jgi:hypothetical protein